MKSKNLDIYGDAPIPWSRALDELNKFETGPGVSCFLSTTGPDGRPHATGIGAVWLYERFYFTSGAGSRKSKNLAGNPNCALAMTLSEMDLVLEGTASRVSDEQTLDRVAAKFNEQGWPATVKDGALTAEYSAPSAGPPPWEVYVLKARVAYGVAYKEPFGAMRWQFED